MYPAKEILKTRHNGKPNSIYVMNFTAVNLQKVNPIPGNWIRRRGKHLIEITQRIEHR